MINLLYKKNIWSLLILLIAVAWISSCRKDTINSRELLIFLQGDKAGSATITASTPFVHSPVAIYGNTMIEVSAYATREVETDIDVSLYPDPDPLNITSYNQRNGTNHVVLPANTYRVVNGHKHKIASGSLKSAPLQIEITDASVLTNPDGYLLPIWISGIETKDKGAKISSSHRMMFIKVTYEFNNLKPTDVPLPGAVMSRAGWSVSVSNSSNGSANAPANMLDGNPSTRWRSNTSSTSAKWIILNMGSVQSISGFRFSPNYANTNENPAEMVVSSSDDNSNWTVQGTWLGSGPAGGSSAANPDYKGINFDAPVQARYWRFDILRRVSSTVNAVGLAEIDAFQ